MEEPKFTQLIDLASEKLGGKTLACSDDFFAPMGNLIKPGRGVFIEGKYTENGKWMDGWESRRKRNQGNDWCILKLGAAGIIEGVDIDTNHFLGNHPPHASVQGCYKEDNQEIDESDWEEILQKSPLEAGNHNYYPIESKNQYTHLRLNIYPDGGVARLKVYGQVQKDWSGETADNVDLASAVNGARAILCNDMFFSHMNNLLMSNPGENMGDGWETKRNRNPDNVDWVIIQLAKKGNIDRIIVDTKHFKGNYPNTCSLDGCIPEDDSTFDENNANWTELLSKSKLEADKEHVFEKEITNTGPFTHVRLNIYPDGGVSRLRLFGKPVNG